MDSIDRPLGCTVAPDMNMDVLNYLQAKQEGNIQLLISLLNSKIPYTEEIGFSWAEKPNSVGACAATVLAQCLNDPSVPVPTTLQKY